MNLTLPQQLAIHGGTPVAASIKKPVWPPVSLETADRLKEVYLSGKWSFAGAEEQAFSQEFAEYHGAKYGIFMANGTVTLQCSLQAYGIGPGDEVIVPALTWIATAMAVLEVGATPVFVDIEETTLCLDPIALEAALTPRTRAIIPVHLLGGMADLDAILEIAERKNLIVIEDCAHGHGGKWKDRGLGSWGHVGSFSFQQTKTMASGEGGICITSDERIAERLYCLKHIGYTATAMQGKACVTPDSDLHCHNYRATEFQATILRDQLKALPQRMATYQANAARLQELLADASGIRIQSRGRCATVQNYYGWSFKVEGKLAEIPIDDLIKVFVAEGLEIGGTYGPVYQHLLWNIPSERYRVPEGGCPVADIVSTTRTLAMGHYWLGSDEATIEAIAAAITKVACNVDALLPATAAC
jgi:L-glutamine:2-deoxy-scyllo-inosose/3-amino-2,3-dideoxy-scyllo-inosose aminotransferase